MRAILKAAAVEVNCPKCKEGIANPDGSFTWLEYEILQAAGSTVECDCCGAQVQIPDAKRVGLE